MRYRIFAFVIVLAAAGCASAPAASAPGAAPAAQRSPQRQRLLDTAYDRFKDETNVLARPGSVSPSRLDRQYATALEVWAWYSFKSRQMSAPPPHIGIAFQTASTRGWQYLERHDLLVLVDDTLRIPIADVDHDGKVRERGGTEETVAAAVPRELFARIANAKKAEVRLGPAEFALTPAMLARFRALHASAEGRPEPAGVP